MKTTLFLLLLPFFAAAQKSTGKYENDTLYTSGGYKIFRGQILEFNKGTMRDGRFRFVKVKNGFLSKTLTNSQVLVKEITSYSLSAIGNGYVDISGFISLKDGSKEPIVLHIAIDRAIENAPELPSEIKVGNEFRNTRPRNIAKELGFARNLYEDNVISKSEYESIKNKLEAQLK